MQNRLKDRDRGGYTSDRYRPHDNYTNAFNMLAQIGLAEKEVTNSMHNAVTQAANVKALQDRLKFDVSSQSAKLKQSALDYNTGLQMKYKDFIQTYMDSNEDKRKKEIEEWIETNWGEYKDDDDDGFKKALNDHIKEVYDMDMAAAKEQYKPIFDIITNHSDDTQEYIEEFERNVFSLYPNNSDAEDLEEISEEDHKTNVFNFHSNNPDVPDNKIPARKIIGSSIIKTNAIIGEFFKKFENSLKTLTNVLDKNPVRKITESSITRTNDIIGKFFKKFENSLKTSLAKEVNHEY